MNRTGMALAALLLAGSAAHADWPYFSDNPNGAPGGWTVIYQGNQRIVAFGGIFLPMRVCVTTLEPDGPVTTRMKFPAALHSPVPPPDPGTLGFAAGGDLLPVPIEGLIEVHIPDAGGLLYVNGKLTDTGGAVRRLQVAPGETVRLRAAFRVGANLLIEDREVTVAGPVTVRFTGERARSVALPKGE